MAGLAAGSTRSRMTRLGHRFGKKYVKILTQSRGVSSVSYI
jgi:hypothetical protein